MDSSDITSLLGGNSESNSLFDLDSIIQTMMPFMVILTIISILLTALYGWSVYQRWRTNHAILEIRDILRDMQAARAPKDIPVETPVVTQPTEANDNV